MHLGWLLVVALCVAALAGCGDDDEPAGTITVFAAASLTDAFDDLGAAFEDAHPGVSVDLSYAGSSALREQILAGAPADVFASANEPNMEAVTDDGTPFATNVLQLAVPKGNEAGVTGLADLANADLLVGLCAEEVPCGQFGREALDKAGVDASIDTNEPDVRSLLTKIEAGELDAGIVYVTDVIAAGGAVEGIDIPEDENVTATYPIAALRDEGEEFVAFVLSGDGRAILESHGFGRP